MAVVPLVFHRAIADRGGPGGATLTDPLPGRISGGDASEVAAAVAGGRPRQHHHARADLHADPALLAIVRLSLVVSLSAVLFGAHRCTDRSQPRGFRSGSAIRPWDRCCCVGESR